MTRCTSSFCVMKEDGVRGREFEPSDKAEGLSKVWCSDCIKLGKQITFFSRQTSEMIRSVYRSYIETNLPKEVKLFLEQFSREIMENLGEEL